MGKNINLNRNHYLVLGLLCGFLFSFYSPQETTEFGAECPDVTESSENAFVLLRDGEFEPQLNLEQKPMMAKKVVKNIIRPRYYYSELGIREKLFVGVLTTSENVETIATAINRTAAHLVDKIKFFIHADNVKSSFNLKNIVGFTDTREHLRPFHMLKYLADNYLDEYDFFLLLTDTTYVNARMVRRQLQHLSVTLDVYIGTNIGYVTDQDENINESNQNQYCDLNAGIILSSGLIRKVRANLDWCVRNAVSNYHSVNIGKCVKYSAKIKTCHQSWQGVDITSYNIAGYKIYRDFHLIAEQEAFNKAAMVYPITSMDDFYLLHAYYSRVHLKQNTIVKRLLQNDAMQLSNRTLSNDILEVRWPLGVPKSNPTESRHDVVPWVTLNTTHSFMWQSEVNVKRLSAIDEEDIRNVLNKTILHAIRTHPDAEFRGIHTAYKRFDTVRGMDYRLLLNFYDRKRRTMVQKSFEVIKPISLIEIIPSPYVTESTRVALLLPVFESQILEAEQFMELYEKTCMESQDNTFLMLIFFYRAETPSKGDQDVFLPLKNIALALTEKHKQDGSRVAWVSIRLPIDESITFNNSNRYSSSLNVPQTLMNFVAVDLALRKIGLESLVIVCTNSASFRPDFLNRVRMNTIQGFQIFSPIGFMMYPCEWTGLCKLCENCDVGQSSGYFDHDNYDVVSFYSNDYVLARKKLEALLPIVRNDKDILNFISTISSHYSNPTISNIADLFTQSNNKMHVLRAIEPNLRFGRSVINSLSKDHSGKQISEFRCSKQKEKNKCIKVASKKQIGEVFVQYSKQFGSHEFV
ncbi:AGAP001050-PA [Anopheles gambiae str. PEST]|uniref:Hexosyltransferase n=1 Tax=Anopheles gambiae TaxID=7165 RepID=Q7PMP8_ANOGA|nr:AGAP001050-PA [Anopheles gambiae str. PEST]